ALILAKADIPVTLLEAAPSLPMDMRASTFHPPTLDLLDRFGITDKLKEIGLITPTFQLRDRYEGLIAEFDLAGIADCTNHPYRVQCEQYKLCGIAIEMLKDYPHVDIRFNAKVTGATQDSASASVTVEENGETRSLSGAYVIGCDGGRSAVRQSAGINFPGFTFPELFVTASMEEEVTATVPDMGNVAYIYDPEEWCAVIHAPNMWRFLIPTKPGADRDYVTSDEFLFPRIRFFAKLDHDPVLVHRTRYDVHQRVADTYNVGRLLIAGDAAHLNNPVGGMGMNGGIQDAYSLADKLVRILNDSESEALLDRYTRQRREIAVEYVHAQTARNKKSLEERDPEVRRKHYDDLRAIAADPKRTRELLLQTTMIAAMRRAEALE
ncbi:MAG: FAD-dependent monooxygenase, partial [Hyphomicrobiales bacterium]|nr:FAD-dependent monooxygenase [Hyphomicrobiales bacterium]